MVNYFILGGAAFALLFTLSACTGRHDRRSHWHENPDRATSYVSSKLALNESQRQELKKLSSAFYEAKRQLEQTRLQSKPQIHHLFQEKELDQKKLLGLIKDAQSEFDKLAPKIVAALADFNRSLTDEQRRKMRDLIEDIQEDRGFH